MGLGWLHPSWGWMHPFCVPVGLRTTWGMRLGLLSKPPMCAGPADAGGLWAKIWDVRHLKATHIQLSMPKAVCLFVALLPVTCKT